MGNHPARGANGPFAVMRRAAFAPMLGLSETREGRAMASKFIEHNPALKKPALAVLQVVSENDGAGRASVESAAAAAWKPAYRLAPSAVVDALVREGLLHEQITVDGQPYDGTLEDVYRDDSVADTAEVDAVISLPEAGAKLLQQYAPAATLAALRDDRPAYAPVFQAALEACAAEGGATREQLEAAIEGAIAQHGITGANGQKVYPQYFIDALETAGGLEWNGAWHTTEAGMQAKESLEKGEDLG